MTMPTAKTTHQWTAADNELEVSGKMWEPDGSLTWLRDEEAARCGPGAQSYGRIWRGLV